MKRKRAGNLIRKYIAGTGSQEENKLLDDHFNTYLQHSRFNATDEEIAQARQTNRAAIQDYIEREKRTRKHRLRIWTSIAATIVLATTLTLVYQTKRETLPAETVADILPGGNKAMLTLTDGRTIDLSSAQEGVIMGDDGIVYADGTRISDLDNQVLGYPEDIDPAPSTPYLMSLSTPNGGQYRITLPDGTKVWLNAASSLKWPSRFTADKREVFLEGEAYFAVDKHQPAGSSKPFIVKTAGQETTVLGTEFNINAYVDEPETKTTVINGAVKVVALKVHTSDGLPTNRQPLLLNPGQQSILSSASFRALTVQADNETGWKEGKFYFKDTPFDVMMRQLARWYDVRLKYASESVPEIRFTGELSRNVTLQTLLSFFEKLNVPIRLQDKILIIG